MDDNSELVYQTEFGRVGLSVCEPLFNLKSIHVPTERSDPRPDVEILDDDDEHGVSCSFGMRPDPRNSYGLATQGFVWAAISSVSGDFGNKVDTVNGNGPDEHKNVNVSSIGCDDGDGNRSELRFDLTAKQNGVEFRILTDRDYETVEQSKRDKNDCRVYRKKKDIWKWSPLKREGYADTPADFLETANMWNTQPLYFDENFGEWQCEPQFWPNGNRKYFQALGPGNKLAYRLNWTFTAYDEDGKTELFRFLATSERKDNQDESLVYWDNQYVRLATTETVNNAIGKVRDKYVSLTQLKPLLYEVTYDDYDWGIAREFFEKEYPVDAVLGKPRFASRPMSCSSVRKGNFHGRNLDWYYDWEPEYIVRVSRREDRNGRVIRHASYGMVSVMPGLTDGVAASKSGHIFGGETEYDIYDIIPFLAVDGQNDAGLVANANVAPAFERGRTVGNQNPDSDLKLCQTQIVRYILDNFATAQEAADFFSKTGTADGANVYGTYNGKIQTEMHFMVSDSSKTFVIEWIDNMPRVTEVPIMTNFHVADTERGSDGHVVVEEGKIEPHASGVERFNLASDEMESVETADDMAGLMRDLYYTRAYRSSPNPSDPYWYSEFVGETETFGDLTVFTPHEEFDKPGGIIEFVDNSYVNRSRDNTEPSKSTWHTTHSIVYDIANKTAILYTQEGEFGTEPITLKFGGTLPYSALYLANRTIAEQGRQIKQLEQRIKTLEDIILNIE